MKTKKTLLPLLAVALLALASCSSTNPLRGKVYMKDGSMRMGTVSLPAAKTKSVYLAPAGQKKYQKLPSRDVSHIMVWHEKAGEDKPSKLLYANYVEMNRKGVKRTSKKPLWMLTMGELPYIGVYTTGEGYRVYADGSAASYITSNSSTDIWYYVQRPNEDMPTRIAMSHLGAFFPANRFFKRWGVHYFSDCPTLAEKIARKELKVTDGEGLAKVIALYGDCKGAKP